MILIRAFKTWKYIFSKLQGSWNFYREIYELINYVLFPISYQYRRVCEYDIILYLFSLFCDRFKFHNGSLPCNVVSLFSVCAVGIE